MPKVVEVPGVGNVEFPDTMNDDQISAAISGKVPDATPPSNFLSRLADTARLGMPAIQAQLGDSVVGAGKSALSHANNAADFLSLGLKPLAEKYIKPLGDARKAIDAYTQPNTGAQKVGAGIESAAEYLAPMGLESGLVKGVDAAAQGMKYAPIIRTAGRGLVSALSAGGVAGIQTKDPKQMATAAETAGLVSGGLHGLSEAAPAIGRGVSAILGKTTGAGSAPLEQAAKNPSPALIEQMRHPNEDEVVGNLKDALQNLKDSRGNAYRQQLAQLPKGTVIDPTPIKEALAQKLEQFRVGSTAPALPAMTIGGQAVPPELAAKLTPRGPIPPPLPGKLDFSASPISDAGQKDIRKVANLVNSWKDWSVLGTDALKRRIDDMYGESKQARAFIAAMKSEVNNNIVAQVPEYAQMTGDYAKASGLLDHLSDLSLTNKNPGTAIRKITTTLNQNNEYRKGLVDILQQYSGTDLNGQVAGLALSKLAPRGIMGPASGAGLMIGIVTGALDPSRAAALALTSPRLMGEVAVALGKVKPLLSKAGPAAKVLPGLAASQAVSQPKTFPQSQLNDFAQAQGMSPEDARAKLESEGWRIQ